MAKKGKFRPKSSGTHVKNVRYAGCLLNKTIVYIMWQGVASPT